MDTLYTRVAADQVVSTSPVYIFAIVITSNGGGDADATLYDGEGTGDPKILGVYTVDEAMASLVFPTPLRTRRGLYIDVGSNVGEILVQYVNTED